MIKLSLYIVAQSTILGTGLRTLGRLRNKNLVEAWKNNQLEPVYLGDKKKNFV